MVRLGKVSVAALLLAAGLGISAARAEAIKIGSLKVTAFAPLFVAQERGYFAAEGVPAEIVWFEAAQPVAVAAVSGAVDFGCAALTGGLYNLAGQGALRIIAAGAHEFPGFKIQAIIASNRAYAAGLTSLKDLGGHSFSLTGAGGPTVYVVGGLLAEKFGFDFKTIRQTPMNSMPNSTAAIAGGQIDFSVTALLGKMPGLVQQDKVKVLGWVGDEVPWQFAATFTATKTADQRADTVRRFLRAYIHGAQDYYAAVTNAAGKREDGPTAPEIKAIVAKYTGQSVAQVSLGLPYVDAQARLDVKDVLHQIAFYKAQGLIKSEVDGNAIIDKRYAVPLPAK